MSVLTSIAKGLIRLDAKLCGVKQSVYKQYAAHHDKRIEFTRNAAQLDAVKLEASNIRTKQQQLDDAANAYANAIQKANERFVFEDTLIRDMLDKANDDCAKRSAMAALVEAAADTAADDAARKRLALAQL